MTINKVLSLSEVTVVNDPGTTGDPLVLCLSTVDPKLLLCPRPCGFWLQSGPFVIKFMDNQYRMMVKRVNIVSDENKQTHRDSHMHYSHLHSQPIRFPENKSPFGTAPPVLFQQPRK